MGTQYIRYPSSTNQAVPTVANAGSLPASGLYDGQLYETLDNNSLYAWNLAGTTWKLLNSSSTVTGSGANGKVAVWTGTSSLSVSASSGIQYLTSGTLNTVADGTANQLLGMNGAASGYEYKSLLGTSNQVTVTAAAGSLTLSLPQNINSGASPTFAGLTLSGLASAGVVHTDGSGVFSTSLIVNADVSASAAIAYSKLSLSNSIVNADVAASAAIAYSKLNLAASIVNADISTSAAIAYSKLSLTGNIVNADINASAAIAYSKLSLTGNIVNADINASAAIAYSKLNLASSVKLASDVTGTLPIGNGGTGQTSASAAFNALSPMTTLGDVIYGGASGTGTRVAGNTTSTKKFLVQTGTGSVSAAPSWATIVAGDLPAPTYTAPTVQSFTSTGTTTGYLFTVTSANATAGATYTNNGHTYTVIGTISSGTSLYCSGASAPTATGTLTKSGGTGDATITFSANTPLASYTKPANVLYYRVRLVGAGGGGAGAYNTAVGNSNAGLNGTNTTFSDGTTILTANGGNGAAIVANSLGAAGGTASIVGTTGLVFSGAAGASAVLYESSNNVAFNFSGGSGGASFFGGAGNSAGNNNGGNAATNSGSGGGGGGGSSATTAVAGGGGGAGGFIDTTITSLSATYFAVGTGGTGGAVGSGGGGGSGGNGADGIIIVEEYYQ